MYSSLVGRVYMVDASAFREHGVYPFIFDPGEHTVIVASDSLWEMALASEECDNYARAINWLEDKIGPLDERTDLFTDEYTFKSVTVDDISLVIYNGGFRRAAHYFYDCGVGPTLICGHNPDGSVCLSSRAMFDLTIITLVAPAPWDGYVRVEIEDTDGELSEDDIHFYDHFADNIVRSSCGAESTNFRLILNPDDDAAIEPIVRENGLHYVDLVSKPTLDQAYFDHAITEELRDYDNIMQGMSIGCHSHDAYLRYREMIKWADKSWQQRLPTGKHYDGGVQFVDKSRATSLLAACDMIGSEETGYEYSEEVQDDYVGEFDDIELYSAIVIENAEQYGYETLENLFMAGTTYAERVLFLYHTPRDNYFLPIQQLNRDYAAMTCFFVIDDRVLAQSQMT